jgi:hypothetical protein
MATVRVSQPNVPFTPAPKALDAERNATAAIVESRMLKGRLAKEGFFMEGDVKTGVKLAVLDRLITQGFMFF